MIRRRNEMEINIRENMRGGKGSAKLATVLKDSETNGNTRLVAFVTLEPGSSIGKHEHINEEESYHILKGTALVNDNGEEVCVSAGDVVLTNNGQFHSIENNGTEVLEFLAVIVKD